MKEQDYSQIDHELKTDAHVFSQSWARDKPWEIRNNDRNFKEGETVRLRETVYTGEEMKLHGKPLSYTGREIIGTVGYVLRGPAYGLEEGWVIFTLQPVNFTKAD